MVLTGTALVRQCDSSIRGRKVEIAGDEGRLNGGGGVVVTLAEPGSDGRPGRTIELAGQDLAYRPETRTLTVTTKAALRLPEARLEAGTISAVLDGDGRGVEALESKTAAMMTASQKLGEKMYSSMQGAEAAAGAAAGTAGVVCCQDERSQHRNKARALEVLRARLYAKQLKESSDAENRQRKAQVGSGQRGDKVRTYRFQDDRVVDNRNGKKVRLADVLGGDLDALR